MMMSVFDLLAEIDRAGEYQFNFRILSHFADTHMAK